tara:strand:- start:362 stop:1384 length:1023 start_codon:yes stop_codon:yes gene_type:complete
MAFNTSAFSPKEWVIGVAEETTVGNSITSYLGIEAESVSFPTINDAIRNTEKRLSSQYRVVNEDDLINVEAGGIHEFSVSGVLTTNLLATLCENAMGVETSSDIVMVDYDHNPTSFLHGATSSGAHNTIAFCIEGPLAGPDDSYTMRGCVITSFTVSANSTEENGRFKFDLTAQTRTPISSTAVAQNINTIDSYSENFVNLGTFTEPKSINATEVVLDSISVTVENPVVFLGNKSSTGEPQGYQRSIPGFTATADCVVKYDNHTSDFLANWRTQTVATPKGLYLANDATWGSATTFGIKMDNVIIAEQPAFDEGDYMKISCKLLATSDETDSEVMAFCVA